MKSDYSPNGEMITSRSIKLKKIRLLITVLMLLAGFVAVLGRLYYVQVVDYRRYTDYSKNQYLQRVNFSPTRGRILDRNMVPLAITVPMKSVFASPGMVDDKRGTATILARDLGMDEGALFSKLEKKGQFAWIKRKVSDEQYETLKSRHLKGISFVPEDRRFYPQKGLASRLVGFCGLDNNGLAGLEYLYDKTLAGEQMIILAQRDAMGKIYGYNGEKAAEGNFEVVSTIDSNVQYIAEKAVKNVFGHYGPKAALAIVMDVNNGEVLAAAEMPELDSNDYLAYPQARHRAISVTQNYEPGSTFKVFVAAAAIEEGVASPDEEFDCENGHYIIGAQKINDEMRDKVVREAMSKKYGVLPLRDIIAKSSNIGMIKVAQKLGEKRLYDYLRRFGFGTRTGIDLPGEVSGSLRDYHTWSTFSMPTISFGQEVNVTPIQLAAALSSLGNGGMSVKPHLLKKIYKNGAMMVEYAPPPQRRIVSQATAQKVVEMMHYTVTHGTGKMAQLAGFEVAGKTGTAQKFDNERARYSDEKTLSSFIALFPVKKPAYSILVMVDEPLGSGWGGEVAAPVAREIISGMARYYGIPAEGQRRYDVEWQAVKAATIVADKAKKPDSNVTALAKKDKGLL